MTDSYMVDNSSLETLMDWLLTLDSQSSESLYNLLIGWLCLSYYEDIQSQPVKRLIMVCLEYNIRQ
jgi:hypothetical protein